MLQWKGEQQEGRVGKPLDPFEVKFLDEEGQPCQLVPVEFKVVQGEGAFTFQDQSTDLGGNAIAEFVPSTDGWYRIECLLGEGDDRKVVPFKGNIKPDRRKRSGTTHGVSDTWVSPEPQATAHQPTVVPMAAVPPPPPLPEEQAQPALPAVPILQVTVSVPPQAVPAPAPKEAPSAEPAEQREARSSKLPMAAPQPKPAPKPVQAAAPRRPQPQTIAATAVLPRPVARPVTQVRRPVAKRRAAKPAISPAVMIGIVVLYALLVGLLGVLAVQTSKPPATTASIECLNDAWVVTGNTITYHRCMATLR